MALSNYTELQAAIASWLNRVDLSATIPDFVRLFEARVNRLPACADEVRTTVTFASGAEYVLLPSTCREVKSLYLDQTSRRGPIEIVPAERLAEVKSIVSPTGYPRFAAISSDGTELLPSPIPDQDYDAKIIYLAGLTGLASASTNWLLTSHPDLYLYGSLVEAEPFLQNDERVATWKGRVDEGLAELEALIERRKFSANTLVIRPRRPIG